MHRVLQGLEAVHSDSHRSLDINNLARQMEGYIPLDIEIVVQRALHSACYRNDSVTGKIVALRKYVFLVVFASKYLFQKCIIW